MTARLRHARRPHRDRRSLKTLDPGRDLPQPPAPPGPVHVVSVTIDPEDGSNALWTFDAPVNDPTGPVAELTVGGRTGLDYLRLEPDVLAVLYGSALSAGDPWELPDGAAGIAGASGETLAGGSGTVEA